MKELSLSFFESTVSPGNGKTGCAGRTGSEALVGLVLL
jgi:hypothetical protein